MQKNSSIGATSWEISHFKIPHTFYMKKPFKSMTLKSNSPKIGGSSQRNVVHTNHHKNFIFMNIIQQSVSVYLFMYVFQLLLKSYLKLNLTFKILNNLITIPSDNFRPVSYHTHGHEHHFNISNATVICIDILFSISNKIVERFTFRYSFM